MKVRKMNGEWSIGHWLIGVITLIMLIEELGIWEEMFNAQCSMKERERDEFVNGQWSMVNKSLSH